MPRFFVPQQQIGTDFIELTGEDARHAAKALRMKAGESITLCDGCGTDYFCTVGEISDDSVICKIEKSEKSSSESEIKVTLYQGLPKSDKLELIIQKCTELGISSVVPVLMYRSVSRPDDKKGAKKTVRWQKIAEEAAKQSQRGIIPEIGQMMSFNDLCEQIGRHEKAIVFYENSAEPFRELLDDNCKDIAIVIGPEGGFEPFEVEKLMQCGASVATLGKRILRTETAGMAALAAIMFRYGQLG